MRESVDAEKLNLLLQKVCTCLKDLFAVFDEIESVLDMEHEAIREGALGRVETTLSKKQKLFDRMNQNYSEMIELSERIAILVEYVPKSSATLRELYELVLEFAKDDKLSSQVLRRTVGEIDQLLDRMKTEYPRIKSKIDMNITVVNKTLINHQESFRFWQNIAAETGATYKEDGTQGRRGSSHIFTAKA